ncbi:PilZ domain-containing protein [Neptunomonas sp.]|uniref:PilZ domain-containing protein n=1 Tax=Neptunomonas sp. TaxID=1971898 RepID=UPI0025E08CC9|nr:PilZ domain-containing protein [Neptunomonas sp.]
MEESIKHQQNRRRFTRINFDADCTLRSSEGEWPVKLIDICLKGALVESHADIPLNIGDSVELRIILDGNEVVITMPALINHRESNHFGFQAMNMELSSVSYLRRLVELNLGDPALLERELVHLYNT